MLILDEMEQLVIDGYVNRVESYSKEIARDAVVYADALIEELEK
jgi:hypothetical protein